MGKLMLDGVEVGLPDRTVTAGGVSYDNTQSGLSATECQSAIDELAARLDIKRIPFSATSDSTYGLINIDMGSASKKLVNIVIDGPSGSWVGQFAQDGQYAYARVTRWDGSLLTNRAVTGYVYYTD